MIDRRYQLVRTPNGFNLEQVRAPCPSPGPGEVLVRVHAARGAFGKVVIEADA